MLTEEQLAAVDALSAVDRIILVGDPSQLPPIGAGRPFIDIVKLLTPKRLPVGRPRIGPGYAELMIGSRQEGAQRQDLEFAELFSGREAGPASDSVIGMLTQADCGPHLRVCSWSSPAELTTMLPQIISEELQLDLADVEALALELIGGSERRWPGLAPATGLQGQLLRRLAGAFGSEVKLPERSCEPTDPARLSTGNAEASGARRSAVRQDPSSNGRRRSCVWRQSHKLAQPPPALGLSRRARGRDAAAQA